MVDVEARLTALEKERYLTKQWIRSADDSFAELRSRMWEVEIKMMDLEESFKEIMAKLPNQTVLLRGHKKKGTKIETTTNSTYKELDDKVNKLAGDLEEKINYLREDMYDHLPERWESTEQGMIVKCAMEVSRTVQQRFTASVLDAELESRVSQLELALPTTDQNDKTERQTKYSISITRLRDNLNTMTEELSVVRKDMDYFVRGYLDVRDVKTMKGQLEDAMAELREILDGTPCDTNQNNNLNNNYKRARVSYN